MMAGVWTELYFEDGSTISSGGLGKTRGWSVVGVGPDAAMLEPQAPKRGDAHPVYPLLVVNSISFSATGFGTSVRAQYVPIEFLDQTPPEDVTSEAWSRIDTDHEDEDVDIPVFEQVKMSFPAPNDTVVEKTVWSRVKRTIPFRKTVVVHRIQVNATVVSDGSVAGMFALTDAITAQHNKIHDVLGTKMLFVSDGSRRIEKDKYQFNYKWIDDPGIPYLMDFVAVGGVLPGMVKIGSEAFPIAQPEFVVPPFKRVDTSPDENDPEALPKVFVSDAFAEDLNGWQTLPGML